MSGPACTCPETDPVERATRYTVRHLGLEPHAAGCPRHGLPAQQPRPRPGPPTVEAELAELDALRATVARVEALHDRLLTIAHDSESLTAVVYRQNADRLRRALDGD